ncbi:hypothetical protein GCM10010353_02410 [Streptomyces chryseus]|nr:hypothetical protein GCM10010353_02410 [Streptomyces chryseus]
MTTHTGTASGVQPKEPGTPGTSGTPGTTVAGPRGVPVLGNLPQFGKDPLAFFEGLRARGDMVRWRFGPKPSLFLADPEHIGELMRETEGTFDQPELGIAFRTVMGNGVVVARGQDWRRKRSLVQPSVRPKQVRSYAATMAECAMELADQWAGGERIDIKREMAVLTQRIAVRTIFGADTGADAEAIGRAMSRSGRSGRSSAASGRCCRTGFRPWAGPGSSGPRRSSTRRSPGSSHSTGRATGSAPTC